ncbi:hypothetical protein [Microbulbifer hydrolyticus]|uniref:DUF3192 domain-containing protein n=1 Tax=Microbulbifer hydrolyticus TaxID=48074 RepID=A0A6P1TAF8_9GAMM|nr:hypothetical protein [Microbulbifer hydrolyticus]MBB5213293.1 hypothetical protein [Microbulbifer hydrolyticus]QHQ38580.1 hypothetical protein GTQ55_06000 [Microbulbifer hydrolyticus]
MRYLLFLYFLFFGTPVIACIADPSSTIAVEPKRFLEKYEIVFFGKIVSFEEVGENHQIITFEVQKSFKGPSEDYFMVENKITSTCSDWIDENISHYYVFGNDSGSPKVIQISDFASFVPAPMAKEYGMELR